MNFPPPPPILTEVSHANTTNVIVPPPPPSFEPQLYSMDIECYINYFLMTVYDVHNERVVREFELYNDVSNTADRMEAHELLNSCTFVTFNGNKYDLLVLTAYLNGAKNHELKALSDQIINTRLMPWEFEQEYAVMIPNYDHIDLIELTPGIHSLKVYGARLRCKILQELPIHENNFILPKQQELLRGYCINDNVVTSAVYRAVRRSIDLRVGMYDDYGIDLRSKSDAQCAETIFVREARRLAKITMQKPNMKTFQREFAYIAPKFIQFTTPRMKKLVDLCTSIVYTLSPKHKINVPKEFGVIHFYKDEEAGFQIEQEIDSYTRKRDTADYKHAISEQKSKLAKLQKEFGAKNEEVIIYKAALKEISDSSGYTEYTNTIAKSRKVQRDLSIRQYTMQIGGLHSKFDAGSHYSDDDYQIFEIDVSSFYPNIIINADLFIEAVGLETFQLIYGGLVDRKNVATARRDEIIEQGLAVECAEELATVKKTIEDVKIFINGFYGKLSSHYSKLYAPGMLITTTITGQLSLLMLLELFHGNNIHVLSANTDGINVRVHKDDREWVDSVVKWWCDLTGFVMDYNFYKSIHYRDVNNYFAHYEDDSVHGIGIFAAESLRISPEYFIVRDACFEYIKNGTPVEETITDCTDIHQFINLRKCTGGALKDGEYIGATIRWYHSMNTSTPIVSAKSGGQVAGSACGMPVMNLPDELPWDLDHQWYVRKAYRVMGACGLLSDDLIYLEHVTSGIVHATADGEECINDVANGVLKTIDRSDFLTKIGLEKKDIRKYNI